jgi:Ca2+-binding RTX toxin-like protein
MRTTRSRLAVLAAAAMVIGSILAAAPVQAAPRCFGRGPTILGTSRSDRINGTSGNDVILGLSGRDRINGRGGNDRICGGDGHDTLRGKAGNDQLGGGSGSDLLLGLTGNDRMVAGGGFDTLIGSDGNDKHSGGSGGDFFMGGLGDDLYFGGGGEFDIVSFFGSSSGVVVDLANSGPQPTGEGTDTITGVEGVEGSEKNDVLKGDDLPLKFGNGLFGLGGVDQILGLAGNDTITGGPGSDEGAAVPPGSLSGGEGNDTICGDECEFPGATDGDDDLYGDGGDDLLDGGANVTAAGDFGDGGTHVAGDVCLSLETNTNCESFTPPPGPFRSRVLARSHAALSAWSSVRALRP